MLIGIVLVIYNILKFKSSKIHSTWDISTQYSNRIYWISSLNGLS